MIRKKSIKLLTIFYALFYTYPSMAEGACHGEINKTRR